MNETKLKEMRLLILTVSIEWINAFLKNKKKYDIFPEDIEVFRIAREDMGYEQYRVVLKSKKFPMVREGEMIPMGDFSCNHRDKKIVFKKKNLVNV